MMFSRLISGLLAAATLPWAFAQRSDCATPGADGNRIIAEQEIVNAYFSGNSLILKGDSVWIDRPAPEGIQAFPTGGALLLVIQMQGAGLVIPDDPTNPAYGSGNPASPMQGWDAKQPLLAGHYEYVAVKTVQDKNDKLLLLLNQPLEYNYIRADAGTDHRPQGGIDNRRQGDKRYQLVLIPQYQNLTLANGAVVSCPPWNGETGGVIAADVNGYLLVPAGAVATVSADGRGFRGGGARPAKGWGTPTWIGPSGADQPEFLHGSRDEAYAPMSARRHGIKGEGIAGTPAFVYQPLIARAPIELLRDGYPGGCSGQGAPGNAGGGGTDAHCYNQHNSGGGGGSNASSGGNGGYTALSGRRTGGQGGSALGTTPERLTMGGGGGSGSSTPEGMQATLIPGNASGAPGGGILALTIRSLAVEKGASLTFSVQGASAPATTDCGGGGGGGGGSILLLAKNVENQGLILAYTEGGKGGTSTTSAQNTRIGPGGGGGGGIMYTTAPMLLPQPEGAPPGNNLLMGEISVYGATAGQPGSSQIPPVLSKVISGFECVPLGIDGITLDQLRAYVVDGQPRLFWSLTAPDMDAAFEIQRSSNGSVFDPLANSSIESNDYQQFACFDPTPLPATGATVFYRVRYKNASGGYWFSPIAELTPDQAFRPFCTPAPNPAREMVTLRYDLGSKPAQIQVFDLSGKVVHSQWLDPLQNKASFPAASLAAGAYILKVIGTSPEFSGTLFNRLVIY